MTTAENHQPSSPIPGDEPVPEELQIENETLGINYVADLWDALTHCAEPKGNEKVVRYLDNATTEESRKKITTSTEDDSPEISYKAVDFTDPEYEIENYGLYTISSFTKEGAPKPHPSWRPEFQLHLGKTEDGNPFFQVFKSETEAKTVIRSEEKHRNFAVPELKDDHLVFKFNAKYHMGKAALDEEGQFRVYPYQSPPDFFNYAEHAILGDNLRLRWSEAEVSEGARQLKLKNGNKLSYGQINGLGGDFFATMDPICMGGNFDDQCDRFKRAFGTLAEDTRVGVREATAIVDNRQREVDAIARAKEQGGSTSQAYKDLKIPGDKSRGLLDKEDEELTAITWDRDGPSYLRMAQLNLDHFGQDARIAYNAGHTCALRAAASGDLELGYAMNAFADHFLGDCFASGHIRTPRRILHGDNNDVQKAVNFILDVIRGKKNPSDLEIKTVADATAAVAPDLCSKYMHDEDNSKGLWVRNRRGEQWQAFGDKKLFEKGNERNMKLMKECLQASADEVYEAFQARQVTKNPDQFVAWQIAPTELADGNHWPLFDHRGYYRKRIDDPGCSSYSNPNSWFKWPPWEGYRILAINLSRSDYFKQL